MDTRTFEELIGGVLDLIIHAKIYSTSHTLKAKLKTLNLWGLSRESYPLSSLSDLFQNLNGRVSEFAETLSKKVQVSFKLVRSQDDSLVAEERWFLHWQDCKGDTESPSPCGLWNSIRALVQDILTTSAGIPLWSNYVSTKSQRSGSCYITYRITHQFDQILTVLGLQRAEIQNSLMGRRIQCSVCYSALNTLGAKQQLTSRVLPSKRGSTSTLATASETDQQSHHTRKVSIYSFQDTQNEITFLSNNDLQLSVGQVQMVNITYRQDDSGSDYQVILGEQGITLERFKVGLRQILEATEQSW